MDCVFFFLEVLEFENAGFWQSKISLEMIYPEKLLDKSRFQLCQLQQIKQQKFGLNLNVSFMSYSTDLALRVSCRIFPNFLKHFVIYTFQQ